MSSQLFNHFSSAPTFARVNEPQTASDYIANKKNKYSFCNPNICHPNKNINSESNLIKLKKANTLAFYPCSRFNKMNLYVNLYSKLLLNPQIPVITDLSGNVTPAIIDINSTTYLRYNIDASGNLFGNTICGAENYLNYLVYDTSGNTIA